jgi:hypothetical protein
MKNFPMHFDLDKRLKETCEKMKNLIELTGDIEWIKLVDLSQMYIYYFFIIKSKTLLFFLVLHSIGCVK